VNNRKLIYSEKNIQTKKQEHPLQQMRTKHLGNRKPDGNGSPGLD